MKKKFSHRLLSFLLVALMICNMLPVSVLAANVQSDNAVTVYMTAMNKGEFVTNGVLNTTWALEEVTVPYFDLALYGLDGLYYNPDCYSGGDKALQEAGTSETAEGVVTILHLFIWVTEVYYHGLDISEAGQGALAHELDWEGFEVYDQTPGSAFIYFWEYGSNLNYYINYEYPLAYIGWGATLDQIALKDGDVVSVRHNMDMGSEELDGRYYHFGAKGDVSKTTTQANDVVLTLYKCAHSLDYSTGHERQGEGVSVYVSSIPVTDAAYAEATYTTNEYGQVTVETSNLEPGTYYVIANTFDPAVMTLTVKAPEHVCSYEPVVTAPTCEEEGYTTYTCSCGDTYESDFVAATGHNYENGVCTACGDVKNVIPEGARFINVATDVDGVCVVEDQGIWDDYGVITAIPYYHLVIPEDAQYVYITYPENCLMVSQWSYAAAYEMPLPYSWETPGRNIEPQAVTNADGSQTISIAVKDYITQIPNDGKGIIMYNQNFNFGEMFTIGYQIEEGYYDVSIPTSERYTVTGETVAKDGYTFSVSINDGYVAGEEFAVKVSGEALTPNEDGTYTVNSVTERLIITVEGVKLAAREPNVFITVDLTDYDGAIDSNTYICYEGPDIEWTYDENHGLVPGESKTYQFHSDEMYFFNVCLCLPYDDGAILGWDVNGTKCQYTGSYNEYDLPAETSDDAGGYLQRMNYEWEGVTCDFLQFDCGIGRKTNDLDEPGTWVFKPIMADDVVAATSVSLDKSELTLTVGAEETLNATVTPENTTDSIVWASSNTAVATVANGKVTAVAAGEATITVTAGEYTAACTVTVEAAAEEKPSESDYPFTVTVGGEAMTEYAIGEVTTAYNGTVPLYTVTIPQGTTEVTITWADGNNYTLSYYDANGGYIGFESGMQNSWTVAMDKNSDGEYDNVEVYDSNWSVPYWITFTSEAAEPEKPAAPFTVTVDGEAMTEYVLGEVTTAYNGTVPLYTVTIPEGTTEVTITWADGNNYTLSYYDANGGYIGFESGMQNSWTVAMDKNSDGEYDNVEVYDSNWSVPYWITFASNVTHTHSYTSAITKEATCTAVGELTYTCECGDSYTEEIPMAEHSWVDASCTAPKTCSICGAAEGEALGHSYAQVKVEATCVSDGYTLYTCSVCGDSFAKDIIKATGHSYTAETKEATCVEMGYTTYTCACGASYVDDIVKALGHKTSSVVTEPTHDKMGYTTTKCENCDYEFVHSWTVALEHEYVKSVTKEATCTAEGEVTFTCQCGASYTQVLPMTGHSCEATVIAPTCTAYGYTSYECKDCDYSYINTLVNPVGHKESVVNAKEAKGHENGYTGDVICSVCGAELEKGQVIEAAGCPSEGFTDVSEKDWFHEAADFVVESKLMNGISATTFAPNAETTRAMMATLLYRVAGEPSIEGAENPFEDVAEDAWYYKAVVWAAKNGVVSGVSETAFDPDAMVTREQMVTMLWRFADKPAADKDELKDYADAKEIGSYAEDAFAWAIGQGLVTGTTETQLSPKGTATRAQIAIILMRYLAK